MNKTKLQRRGLLLIDSGSDQRETAEELYNICAGVKEKGGYVYADYCFLGVELPYIEDAMAKCLKPEEIDSLTIVPYFLYPGRKVKKAVVKAISYQEKTSIKLLVTRATNMHNTLTDVISSRITAALKEGGVAPSSIPDSEIDILIIGHGSLDPNAHRAVDYVMNGLKDRYRNTSKCWLEIQQPDVPTAVKNCEANNPKVLVIVFYFLHEGVHVKNDINNLLMPALEESTIKNFYITKHIGADQRMIDLVLERAAEVESTIVTD